MPFARSPVPIASHTCRVLSFDADHTGLDLFEFNQFMLTWDRAPWMPHGVAACGSSLCPAFASCSQTLNCTCDSDHFGPDCATVGSVCTNASFTETCGPLACIVAAADTPLCICPSDSYLGELFAPPLARSLVIRMKSLKFLTRSGSFTIADHEP